MPYCKSVAIHGHVDKTLSYILDPDKTEKLLYTTSINCMTEAELAYQQMKAVYEQYSRRSYDAPQSKSGKSAVKAIHYIISFADSENVTPELAHKIAKTLVRKNFGDDAQWTCQEKCSRRIPKNMDRQDSGGVMSQPC